MISIIVPVFNEAECIQTFVSTAQPVLADIGEDYEIIFVNDGSSDETEVQVEAAIKINPKIKTINFSRNFGKDAAMSAGLKECIGDYAVLIDVDLEHPPATIKDFFKILQNPEIYQVSGVREGTHQTLMKGIMRKVFHTFLNKYSSIYFPENATDFCMMKREVIDAMNSMNEKERFIRGLLSWHGFKTEYIKFKVGKRSAGVTSFSPSQISAYARKGFISFSSAPLKIWVMVGSFFASLSFLYILYVILSKIIFGNAVPGFVTLVCMVGFFGGLNLIVLGVIGEYIAELFNEIKDRPLYIKKNSK